MGGEATSSGINYQARVIAYVYAHILAQTRLGWRGLVIDTPIAVSGETRGPGDDARIEFGSSYPAIEVQAKHGLRGGANLADAVARIGGAGAAGGFDLVVIAVDRGSSRPVHLGFARDLERLQAGRTDGLRPITQDLLPRIGGDLNLLRGIKVVPLDVDLPHHPEQKYACDLLGRVLANPDQAPAAWDVLVADAVEVCARRLARTRKDLVDRLTGVGISVCPSSEEQRWHNLLDSSRFLLMRGHSMAAFQLLTEYEKSLRGLRVEAKVRYRFAQQRGAALLQLERFSEALESAKRALDIDENGVHALVTAAFAAALAGKQEDAVYFANKAVETGEDQEKAWAARAQVSAFCGERAPEPPDDIAATSGYRIALAQVAANRGGWNDVLSLTAGLLAEDDRSTDVLFLRATAMLTADVVEDQAATRRRYAEAERLTSELIEIISDETNPQTVKALALRARARGLLGQAERAEADLDLVRRIAPEDPDVILHSAQVDLEAGRPQAAIALLLTPTVGKYPILQMLRARVQHELGNDNDALEDIKVALDRIGEIPSPGDVRMLGAETALLLGELDLADGILEDVPAPQRDSAHFELLSGRAAADRGDLDGAIAHYREAASRRPELAGQFTAELGSQLLRNDQPERAIAVFDGVDHDELPEGGLAVLARALIQANELPRAKELVDRFLAQGELPGWALDIATDLAFRQEDVDKAVSLLQEVVSRGEATPSERLHLAGCLVELGRTEEAWPYVEVLTEEAELTPLQRMQTAQLLATCGRGEAALSLALDTYRSNTEDPRIHRGFVGTVFMSHVVPPQPEEVGPETHATLVNDRGVTRAYTIYSQPPFDSLRNDLSVEDAASLGLLGLKRNEALPRREDSSMSERWVVTDIVPAVSHAVHDAMAHYEGRFPTEPFFVKSFSFGDGSSVRDFAPIVASLHERREHAVRVFALYREQVFPLGFIVKLLGGSIAEVMDHASSYPDTCGPLFVEWRDRDGQSQSLAVAFKTETVVLTRSAVQTLGDLGLLDTFSTAYLPVAPLSLLEELRDERREAEIAVDQGMKTMSSDGPGISIQGLDAGDARLVARRDGIGELLRWVQSCARIEPRPLDAIRRPGSQEEEARELIGRGSFDALTLSARGYGLFADDLGLRRMAVEGAMPQSFSSVSLLYALAQRGLITARNRDEHLLKLVLKNYVFVMPSTSLLMLALARSWDVGQAGLSRCFSLLASPEMEAFRAAAVAGELHREVALSPVQIVPLSSVVGLSLRAMASRWPRELCAVLISRAAERRLALLPRYRRQVEEVCERFARGEPPLLDLPPDPM